MSHAPFTSLLFVSPFVPRSREVYTTTKTTTQLKMSSVSEHWWSIWRRDVVCSREQSITGGCRRFVGFVSEWLKRRRTSGASALFEFPDLPWVCPIATADIVSGFGHVAEKRSVFHRISSLEVRGSCVVCCTVSVCTTGVRNND